MLNAQNAKDVIQSLPKSSHGDHPAVRLAVDDGLHDVCDSRECKEDCEEDGRAKVGTEVP